MLANGKDFTKKHDRIIRERRRFKFFLICIAALSLFLMFAQYSPQQSLVINKDCKVEGFFPTFKAEMQGEKFWELQLKLLDRRIESLANRPAVVSEANRKDDEIARSGNDFMAKAYERYPSLKPSDAQATANELRKIADNLEVEDRQNLFLALYARERESLTACRPIIEEKAKQAK